ncbi:hypothetical protein C1645_769841, partial [Glomus cerebriforme]
MVIKQFDVLESLFLNKFKSLEIFFFDKIINLVPVKNKKSFYFRLYYFSLIYTISNKVSYNCLLIYEND